MLYHIYHKMYYDIRFLYLLLRQAILSLLLNTGSIANFITTQAMFRRGVHQIITDPLINKTRVQFIRDGNNITVHFNSIIPYTVMLLFVCTIDYYMTVLMVQFRTTFNI
jgi:hypothetical protein